MQNGGSEEPVSATVEEDTQGSGAVEGGAGDAGGEGAAALTSEGSPETGDGGTLVVDGSGVVGEPEDDGDGAAKDEGSEAVESVGVAAEEAAATEEKAAESASEAAAVDEAAVAVVAGAESAAAADDAAEDTSDAAVAEDEAAAVEDTAEGASDAAAAAVDVAAEPAAEPAAAANGGVDDASNMAVALPTPPVVAPPPQPPSPKPPSSKPPSTSPPKTPPPRSPATTAAAALPKPPPPPPDTPVPPSPTAASAAGSDDTEEADGPTIPRQAARLSISILPGESRPLKSPLSGVSTPILEELDNGPWNANPLAGVVKKVNSSNSFPPASHSVDPSVLLDVDTGVATSGLPLEAPPACVPGTCVPDLLAKLAGAYNRATRGTTAARQSLFAWLRTPGVAPMGDQQFAAANYPWFTRHRPRPGPVSDSDPMSPRTPPSRKHVRITLLIRDSSNPGRDPVEFCVRGSTLAEDATHQAVEAFGYDVSESPLPWVLKLTGWNDFLTAPKEPLHHYTSIVDRLRADATDVDLTLCPISSEEAMVLWGPGSQVRYACGFGLPSIFRPVAPPALPPASLPRASHLPPPVRIPRAPSSTTAPGLLPVDEAFIPLRIRPFAAENLCTPAILDCSQLQVKFAVTAGGYQLDDAAFVTDLAALGPSKLPAPHGGSGPKPHSVAWVEDFVSLGLSISTLPVASRLVIVLLGSKSGSDKLVKLAHVSLNLFDEHRVLRGGKWAMCMFHSVDTREDDAHVVRLGDSVSVMSVAPLSTTAGVCCENEGDMTAPVVMFELDTLLVPVQFPPPNLQPLLNHAALSGTPMTPSMFSVESVSPRVAPSSLFSRPGSSPGMQSASETLSEPQLHMLRELLNRDPFTVRNGFTLPERRLLWKVRNDMVSISAALPKLLRCVSWNRLEQRLEVYALLQEWTALEPDHALQLLDSTYSDEVVRAFAVKCLEMATDTVLEVYLQALVQMVKYEPFHDSHLARFLLRRALWNPHRIGHQLFWFLKSEMHLPGIRDRFGCMLDALVSHSGVYVAVLDQQHLVNQLFEQIAIDAAAKPKAERTAFAKEKLAMQLPHFPPVFQLPLSPRMLCTTLHVDKCKVLDSKKAPLWLEFENADPCGSRVLVIYKAGDDLRQDIATLRLIRTMSDLWAAVGMHLPTQCYLVVGTGDETGMIEVVQKSATLSSIQAKRGNMMGAWVKTPIIDHLRKYHPDDDSYKVAVDKFVRSCAAYCVATHVLGIGDRHPSNIMVTESGNLFHIDFGHFLGNFKEKTLLGIRVRRERAPFVFTPQMAHVMGGRGDTLFRQFEDYCVGAYNTVRKHGNIMLLYFICLLPSGLPELESASDITYLHEKLALEISNADAAEQFKAAIDNALRTVSRQLDNMVHTMVHN